MHAAQRPSCRWSRLARAGLLTLLVSLMALGPATGQDQEAAAFGSEQLEQIVAPIALYPDALLAQVLMASTYPLEIVEAERWVKANPDLKEKELEDALQSQSWDASVKSLTAFPQVLAMMNDKLDWTQKLGDAFLAQQGDVMDAVQRLRHKAQAEGNLESNEEQKVVVEPAPSGGDTTVIQIQPASPQVVYVPTYNPTVVYGAWPYPAYPPYYYYPPGYVASASIISFGVGMAVGAALWGDCHWGGYGHNNVNINVNRYNNFNRTDIKNGNWQHKPEHRKGVGYRDTRTQQQYGKGQRQGSASREAFRGRAEQGRRDIARQGTGAVQRDLARSGGAGGSRDLGRAGGGQRPGATRPAAGGGRSNASRAPSGFQGMGNGSQVRRDSSRGHASRQQAGLSRSGGRSFGGGGRGGGGFRGGGGGGRRR